MKDYRVPTSLDDPKKAFIWDMDVFMIFIMGCGIGIFTKFIFLSISITLFFCWRWGKLKSGKHQWFFLHILYWFMPIDDRSKRIPQTHQREFLK